jgi:hypothetical protein
MKKQTQPHRGGKWEKQDGGFKECFPQINMDKIIAACDRFLEAREPNFAANEAKRKLKAFGRNFKSGELI